MTNTTITTPTMVDVIESMRSIQTESDRWHLAEALHAMIPNGVRGFSEIIDAATAAGVAGGLKVNTLRLYRDTAIRWPADKRVRNVSFSAHREAMVLPSIDAAAKMLGDLAKNLGTDKVTVASVRKAIAVQSGKVPSTKGTTAVSSPSKVTPSTASILSDLCMGAPILIAAITPTLDPAELDQLHAGLSKAIAHVEKLRASNARKAKSAKGANKGTVTPAVPSNATPAKAAARKPQGDLRGL